MLLNNIQVDIIDNIAKANSKEIAELQALEPGSFQLQADDEPNGSIWIRLKSDRKFKLWTGFEEHEILALFRAMKPSILRYRRRGPQPKISWGDTLILSLTFYHLGLKFEVASAVFGISTTAMKEAIARIRPILHSTLSERWLEQKKRPVPLLTTNYPYIGLLVDSMSIEVFRPKGRFEEAKVYWDAKNCMYALKKLEFLQLNRTMLSSFKKLVLALLTITKCTKEDIISTKNIILRQQMRETRFQMILILVE
jgi:hypothetical protein